MNDKRRKIHQQNSIINKLREDHDLVPFITLKYLSQKQENHINNMEEFEEEYGFEFRDYELLSNIINKQENGDESYISDLKSSINVLKNSNNEYLKEIFTQIPQKTLKQDILEEILLILNTDQPIKRLYDKVTGKRLSIFRRIRLPPYLIRLLSNLASVNHEVKNVYNPTCRDAETIVKLKDFDNARLFEKDTTVYYHAIQNMIINDIPLDKVNITNEEIIVDQTDTKYDTIVSIPYIQSGQQKLLNPIDEIDKLKPYKSRNPSSVHLLNLINHLSDNGILITITSMDLLVKKDADNLRKCLIERNILDSIIEYDKPLRNTNNIILIINKNKQNEDVLFIKESDETLRPYMHPSSILKCYESRKKIKRFSDLISNEELKENDYNLNPRRYVYTLNYKQKDLKEVISNQQEYTAKIRSLDEEIDNILDEIKKL